MLSKIQREREERKAIERRKIEDITNELREVMLSNDVDIVDSIMQPLSVEMYNNVLKLLSKDETETLNLIYNPPKWCVGSTVLVIDRELTTTVVKVTWNVFDEYHIYYLQDIEGCTFRQEQIQGISSTIDDSEL